MAEINYIEPFSSEWEKELSKLKKETIIKIAAQIGKELSQKTHELKVEIAVLNTHKLMLELENKILKKHIKTYE